MGYAGWRVLLYTAVRSNKWSIPIRSSNTGPVHASEIPVNLVNTTSSGERMVCVMTTVSVNVFAGKM